ncbi:MAG: molecular chaperone TorD family protein [Rhodospirillales bacterium]
MTDLKKNDNPGQTPEILARSAIERSSLYGFLATIFRDEPSEFLLRQIRSDEFIEAFRGACADFDAEGLSEDGDRLAEELAVEFTGLFCGPGGHVSPHGSVHSDGGGGVLWGAETSKVKSFIEEAGFEYDPGYHGIPDHISVELEFMAEVVMKEAEAWREKDFAKASNCLVFENNFLQDHLLKWVFNFCEKVTERARLPFYRDFARLTADFMESEKIETVDRMGRAVYLQASR